MCGTHGKLSRGRAHSREKSELTISVLFPACEFFAARALAAMGGTETAHKKGEGVKGNKD